VLAPRVLVARNCDNLDRMPATHRVKLTGYCGGVARPGVFDARLIALLREAATCNLMQHVVSALHLLAVHHAAG
jgi:hypothetical protein